MRKSSRIDARSTRETWTASAPNQVEAEDPNSKSGHEGDPFDNIEIYLDDDFQVQAATTFYLINYTP